MIGAGGGWLRELLPYGLQLASWWASRIPSEREQLELELLRHQVESLRDDSVQVVREMRPADLVGQRVDVCVIGPRGSGKTALACWVAQTIGLPWILVGARPEVAAALGAQVGGWAGARDCTVVIDEASVRVGRGRATDELFESLALARQRNVSWVLTAQTASATPLEVLRMGAILAARGMHGIGSLVDRSELGGVLGEIARVGKGVGLGADRAVSVWHDGQVAAVLRSGLPAGWTNEVSCLWR